MIERPRRLRRSETIRSLLRETRLSVEQLVYPLFINEDPKSEQPILAMPGQSRLGIEKAFQVIETCIDKKIKSFALFPVVSEHKKDRFGSESKNKNGLFPSVIFEIKKRFPEVCLFTDVALDPYSSDGHDGLVEEGQIVNDKTLPLLAEMALVQAQAGSDFVAPSDMMDGRIGYLRSHLDKAGYEDCGILAYSAKYASSFYGPFRQALDSAPKSGDKKTYQMDYCNSHEAEREAVLDIKEGADILMIKPALSYLDVIVKIKKISPVPVAAYNVSGEYSMLKFAIAQGILDEKSAILEVLTSIARAGADIILTYHAPEAADFLSGRFK